MDYLALLGDAADNIKGVAGIGQKKALSLVQQYQTIENMYTRLDEMESSVAKILSEQKNEAFASKKLIQLANVDVSHISLESLKFDVDYDKFLDILCGQYGFSSLHKVLIEMKKENEKPQQLGLF